MNTQRDFHELAMHVDALLDRDAISLADAGCILAKFIQEQLGCTRVSLWLLDSAAGTRALHRFAGFDTVAGNLMARAVLLLDAHSRPYLDALMAEGIFVSDDCLADDRLASMRESYLVSNRIRAAMHATIASNGAARAVICCEEQGAPRHWSRHELALLRRCAAEISLRRAKRHYREGAASSVVNALVRKMATRAKSDLN